MGYSISVDVRNSNLQSKMLEFMGREYRPWERLVGRPETYSVQCLTDDISYGRVKGRVGFDYGCLSGMGRAYVYALTRWVALKVGRSRRVFSKNVVKPSKFETPVPYMLYDGFERWPIITLGEGASVETLPAGQRWCAYDLLGGPLPSSTELSMACMSHATREEIEAYGKNSTSPPSDRAAAEAWREEDDKLMVESFRPTRERLLPILRGELQRLEAAWLAL